MKLEKLTLHKKTSRYVIIEIVYSKLFFFKYKKRTRHIILELDSIFDYARFASTGCLIDTRLRDTVNSFIESGDMTWDIK